MKEDQMKLYLSIIESVNNQNTSFNLNASTDMFQSITDSIKNKQDKIVQNTSSSIFNQEYVDAIIAKAKWELNPFDSYYKDMKEDVNKIILQTNNSIYNEAYIDAMIKKIAKDKKEKLNLFVAGFNISTKNICSLFKKLDEYHLTNSNDDQKIINTVLDELNSEVKNRDSLYNQIEDLK